MEVAARIGPNAVTRLAEALDVLRGRGVTTGVFAAAGLAHRLEHPPEAMVAEDEVAALHASLRRVLPDDAQMIAAEAGRRTAGYLLAHRIPRPMRVLLPRLPPMLSARILLRAIGRHAWTFVGSGRFSVVAGPPLQVRIAGGPLARGVVSDMPVCAFYAGSFEVLFRALVSPRTMIREIACQACGADACIFEIGW